MSKSNTKKRGPWRITKSRTVYKNPWISIREDSVIRPDGKPGIFGVVTLLSGIGVVAVDTYQNVFLTKEFHYALGKINHEVVSGGIEKGENKLTAAKRELKEELGLIAKKWTYMGKFHPLTSIISAENHLYLAQGLTQTKTKLDGTEKIKLVKIPFRKAINWIKQGNITDGTSIVALLKAEKLLN